MICSKCNTHNDNASKFCKACGIKFIGLENPKSEELKNIVQKVDTSEKNRYCISCGTSIKSKIKYCPSCGSQQQNNGMHISEPGNANSSRIRLILLGITLFLLAIGGAYYKFKVPISNILINELSSAQPQINAQPNEVIIDGNNLGPSNSHSASVAQPHPQAESKLEEDLFEVNKQIGGCVQTIVMRTKKGYPHTDADKKFMLLIKPRMEKVINVLANCVDPNGNTIDSCAKQNLSKDDYNFNVGLFNVQDFLRRPQNPNEPNNYETAYESWCIGAFKTLAQSQQNTQAPVQAQPQQAPVAYIAELSCIFNGKPTNIAACFIDNSYQTTLELKNGDFYKMYQSYEVGNKVGYKDQSDSSYGRVVYIDLKNNFSIKTVNASSTFLLNLIVKDKNTGKIVFQKSASKYQTLYVYN